MISSMSKVARNIYQQYELVTCISMFEPWERRLINSFMVFILTLVLYSSCVYLPDYIVTFLHFISPVPTNGPHSASAAASSFNSILQPQKIIS